MSESKVYYPAKNFDEVNEVFKVEEECMENVTQCVKSCDNIVTDNVVSEGVLKFECLSSNFGTCESMSKEKEGENRMDSLCSFRHL